MSRHKTFIANLQYPRFSGSPAFGLRARAIAQAVLRSGADSAVFNEAGYNECARLSDYLPWQYDRAQGRGRGVIGEGLNSVWSDPDVWVQPEDRISDYSLPSFGQWQRTALGARLEEKADRTAFAKLFAIHFAAKGAPLSAASADAAKLAQVKYLRKKVGSSRNAWMGDFPRTGRTDDLNWLRGQRFEVEYASSRTPLAVVVQGAVTVHSVVPGNHGSMFDHDYLVVDWSVTGDKEKA